MEMVRHENIGIDPQAKLLLRILQKMLKVSKVLLLPEDLLPLIASADDVVESSREVDAGLSCHGLSPSHSLAIIKLSKPDTLSPRYP